MPNLRQAGSDALEMHQDGKIEGAKATMPPIVQVGEVFAGVYTAMMQVRLAAVVPVAPFSLAGMIEVSWAGYSPSGLAIIGRTPNMNGWSWLYAGLNWKNNSGQTQTPAALWVQALVAGIPQLLGVLLLPSGGMQALAPGLNTWTLQLQAFESV